MMLDKVGIGEAITFNSAAPCDTCKAPEEESTEHKSPFHCKGCGALHFPLQYTGDKVAIWPIDPPDMVGDIWIPETAREPKYLGIVLNVGPGYYVNVAKPYQTPKYKFRAPSTMLEPNTVVVFDETVPFKMEVRGLDGKMHYITLMGAMDVIMFWEEIDA